MSNQFVAFEVLVILFFCLVLALEVHERQMNLIQLTLVEVDLSY